MVSLFWFLLLLSSFAKRFRFLASIQASHGTSHIKSARNLIKYRTFNSSEVGSYFVLFIKEDIYFEAIVVLSFAW